MRGGKGYINLKWLSITGYGESRETENGESLKQEISKTGSFYEGESLRRVISTGFLKKTLKSVWS